MKRRPIRLNYREKSISQITHREWVMLRMLYYILSTDTSSATVKDVRWSKEFIAGLIGYKTIPKAFDLIRKDQIATGAYDNPESWAMTRLRRSINRFPDEAV